MRYTESKSERLPCSRWAHLFRNEADTGVVLAGKAPVAGVLMRQQVRLGPSAVRRWQRIRRRGILFLGSYSSLCVLREVINICRNSFQSVWFLMQFFTHPQLFDSVNNDIAGIHVVHFRSCIQDVIAFCLSHQISRFFNTVFPTSLRSPAAKMIAYGTIL